MPPKEPGKRLSRPILFWRKGIAPGAVKQAQQAVERAQEESFQAIAEEWFQEFRHTWTDSTAETICA